MYKRQVLDELLIDHVSALRAAGVVSLNRVSHDLSLIHICSWLLVE